MNDDDLTNDLTRELHGRVDAIHGSSLGLGDVQVRARSIRRRRAATAVMGVIAAVAIIAPTAAVAGREMRGDHSLPPATQNVSPTPTATDVPAPVGPGVLDVGGLPTGAAPGIAYAEGGLVHQPDGSTVAVGAPGRRLNQLAQLSDGSLVFLTSDSNTGVSQVTVAAADGSRYGPFPATHDVAVNPYVAEAAWVDPDGSIEVWLADQHRAIRIVSQVPADLETSVAALTGQSCATSCQIYLNVDNGPDPSAWHPFVVDGDGTTHDVAGPLVKMANVDRGRLVGYTSIRDLDTCSALVDAGGGIGWKSCRNSLDAFSPDGALVLAGPQQRDGIGDGVIAMYDAATGDRLFNRVNTLKSQAFLMRAVWEDDSHALASVFQANHWSIVRFGADGSMEYALPPVTGNMDHNPYILATGGMSSGG
jgi:hypothetical protein